MKVMMLVLALFGPPADGNWRVIGRAMVPPDWCQAQADQFNRKGVDTRVVCIGETATFAMSCVRGMEIRAEQWEP